MGVRKENELEEIKNRIGKKSEIKERVQKKKTRKQIESEKER